MQIEQGLYERVVMSLDWLVCDARYRFEQCKDNLNSGSTGGYSEELTMAIDALNELKMLITDFPSMTSANIEIQTYTKQQCIDTAVIVGKTEAWGIGYYNNFASQGWLKANKMPITSLRLHMTKLRNDGVEYGAQQETPEATRDENGLTMRQRHIQKSGK